jgi:hypothetical protein
MTTHASNSRFSFDQNGEELLPGLEEGTPVEVIGRMLRRWR